MDEEDDAADPLAARGREVHVTTSTHSITQFMEVESAARVCFRCGQSGHTRFQCLTYKVRLCWHHQQGHCRDARCTFAHGAEELRTPRRTRCVHVIKQDGQLICIGCNSSEHTFRKCPLHQDVLLL